MIIRNSNRNLNQAFDEMFSAFPSTWGRDSKHEVSFPAVNIYESKAAFHIELNAAGRQKEDFTIALEKNVLSISGESKLAEQTEMKAVRKEFGYSNFKRSFTVDEKINADGIEAKYENGILKVTLPKKEEVKNLPKQIQVQ